MGRLDQLDLTQRISRSEYDEWMPAAQRRMLQQAIQHKTDEQITQSLGLSVSAVKKMSP